VSAAFEGRGEVIQRRKSLLVGVLVFYAVAIAMLRFRAPAWAALIELALGCVLAIAFVRDDYRVRREGSLRGDARGLWFNGGLIIDRRKILTAYRLATERPIVHVVASGWVSPFPQFDVVLEDEVQARALLEAIGFSLGQSVATFRATYGSRWRAAAVIVLAPLTFFWLTMPVLRHLGLPGLFAAEATFFSFLAVAMTRFRARVDVGSDGILLRRLGQRRFFSYRALDGASVRGRLILLSLRTGERIRLDVLGGSSEQSRSHEALAQRIEEARAAFVESADTATAEAWVAPGGRPVADWLREVRALTRARDYREARVDAERLWRVVVDPSASPATRAGAALALTGTVDGDTRARLRVAAEACADPKLRVALRRVAHGATDVELAEALDGLVETRPPPSRTDR
jgi:hypothetical protein